MKCEICDTATATMWVEAPTHPFPDTLIYITIPSCDDCGPQLGYKVLAPLEPVSEGS